MSLGVHESGVRSPPETARDFGSFYQTTVRPLRAYLARLLGDRSEAQDVAHNAFVRIQSSVECGQAREPRLLLFTTARRLALNELRRRRNQQLAAPETASIEALFSSEPSVERVVGARQELARFEEMLLRLPPACRQVFLLRKVNDLTHDEIARRLGLSVKTVENHMTRAYRLLREAYAATESSTSPQRRCL
ncbi:MAG: RNA polymerase sigma factor [Opitutaceae bacterium]